LFVNYQDIVISLKEELKYFEHNYCELLDFASQIMAKLEKNRSDDNIYKITNILNALIAPYKYFCIMYITSDVLLWSRRPLDNYTLHAKFAMFFDTMKRVYGILHERFPDVDSEPIAEQLLYDSSYGFYESNILHMLKTFDKCGLKTWAEPVLDSLWRMSYPILPLIYPSYYKKAFKEGDMKDWKKILEDHPESKNYVSEDEQLSFDE
jgi:hypothetical protein